MSSDDNKYKKFSQKVAELAEEMGIHDLLVIAGSPKREEVRTAFLHAIKNTQSIPEALLLAGGACGHEEITTITIVRGNLLLAAINAMDWASRDESGMAFLHILTEIMGLTNNSNPVPIMSSN